MRNYRIKDISELKNKLVKSIIFSGVIYYLLIFNAPLFYLVSIVSSNDELAFKWFTVITSSLIASSCCLYIFNDMYNYLVFRYRTLLLDLIDESSSSEKVWVPAARESLVFKICELIEVERQCEAEHDEYDEASISKDLKLTLKERLHLVSVLSLNFKKLDSDYRDKIIKCAKSRESV